MKHGFGFAARSAIGPLTVAFALAGCGGGGREAGGTGSTASSRTPQEEIARLEASGELPVLEREPTLGGIDANHNGVRDDIEAHIEKKYAEPAQRAAAMQTARAYQQMLLVDKSNAVALDAVSTAGARAVNCVSFVFPSIEEFRLGHQMANELEALTANTKDRLLAYLAYNKSRSGTVSRMPEGDTCD